MRGVPACNPERIVLG